MRFTPDGNTIVFARCSEIINEGSDDLVMIWVVTPHGLEKFFEAIGRPREAGAPAPTPFERPTDVVAIERTLGMNDTVR